MKIIKMGELPKKTKRFTCMYCKTVFEADDTEYIQAGYLEQMHDGITAYCNCPVCGNVADV